MHLISQLEENLEVKETSSEKENPSLERPKSLSINKNPSQPIQPLSPVEIVEVPAEIISEPICQFKEPAKASLQNPRPNRSLRRSLFRPDNNLICSTPTTNRECRKNSFFNANNASSANIAINLSPIRSDGPSALLNTADFNGIEQLVPQTNKTKKKDNNKQEGNSHVESLAIIENEIRNQYSIQEEKTPRKSRARTSEPTSINRKRDESFRSEPRPSCIKTNDLKNLTVRLTPMDISHEIMSQYRHQTLNKLSTSNQTNVNSVHIIETPIVKGQRLANCDSLLAKKLQQCESDLTNDENSSEISSKHSAPVQNGPKRSRVQRKISSIEVQNPYPNNNDDSEEESIQMTKNTLTNTKKKSRRNSSDESREYQTPKKSKKTLHERDQKEDSEDCEKNDESSRKKKQSVFQVPFSPKKSKISKIYDRRQTVNTPDSNTSNGIVSDEVIQSFRTLQRPTNESTLKNQSQKVAVSTSRTAPKKITATTMEYLGLENKFKGGKGRKKKKMDSRKRTLYNNQSIEEDSNSRHNNVEIPAVNSYELTESDNEILKVVEIIRRRSLSVESTMSSIFDDVEVQNNNQNDFESDEYSATEKRSETKTDDESPAKTSTKKITKIIKTKTRQNSRDTKLKKNTQAETEVQTRESTDMNQSDSEIEEEHQAKKVTRGRKPTRKNQINSEVEDSNDKRKASKRKNVDKEENQQTKSKQAKVASHSESDMTESTSKETDSDEGIQTDCDTSMEIENIRYDPYERGCKRPGLRIRRYPTPWWMHGNTKNIGLVYSTLTKQDVSAASKLKQLSSKNKIILNNSPSRKLDVFLAPNDKLKIAQQSTKVKKKAPKVEKKAQKIPSPKLKVKTTDGKNQSDNDACSSVVSGSSHYSTASSRSEIISKAFDVLAQTNNEPTKIVETDTYGNSFYILCKFLQF